MHTADYVDRFTHGALTRDEERRLGFPWSEALVERSYRAAGGTLEAARHALDARRRDEPRRRNASRLSRSRRRILRLQRRRRRDSRAAARRPDRSAPRSSTSTCIRETARTPIFAGDDERVHVQHARRAKLSVSQSRRASRRRACRRHRRRRVPRRCSPTRFRACSPRARRSRRLSRRRRPARARRLGRLALTFEDSRAATRWCSSSAARSACRWSITIAGGYSEPDRGHGRVHVATARIASRFARP